MEDQPINEIESPVKSDKLISMDPNTKVTMQGKAVNVYSLKEGTKHSDYIIVESDIGEKVAVHRAAAIARVYAMVQALERETGSADPGYMDKTIWLCRAMFKAAVENGVANKKASYCNSQQGIKEFDNRILRIEKTWKNNSDWVRTNKLNNKIAGF